MATKATPQKKAATKKAASKRKPVVKAGDLQSIIPELKKMVGDIDHFQKTGEVINNGTQKAKPSFKEAIHDTIVAHEMLNTKHRVEAELKNCGEIFYVTEKEAEQIKEDARKVVKSMAIDALVIGAGCFLLGVFYGRKQIIDLLNNN